MGVFFEQMIQSGEVGLQALVDAGQQEHVQLDFKSKDDPSHGSMSDSDKRTLAEALSGFSNSAGGLLIWGIDARKGADGVDCAQHLRPIMDIARFQSNVTTLIGQYLMPKHEGVQVASISSAEDPTSGFLLLDVDRSERRPHRSEAKGKKGYIKRSGNSFFEMEHYDIEDAFNRNRVSTLELFWRVDKTITYGRSGEGGYNADLVLQLRNSSPITAKYPYLLVEKPVNATLKITSPQDFRIRREGGWFYFVGGADQVINPETKSSIATLNIEFRPKTAGGPIEIVNQQIASLFLLSLKCKFGCENTRLRDETIVVSGAELLDLLK